MNKNKMKIPKLLQAKRSGTFRDIEEVFERMIKEDL